MRALTAVKKSLRDVPAQVVLLRGIIEDESVFGAW